VIERAVLRLAVWEMTHEPDIPNAVAINEAVVLAKLFGSEHSYKFVNGVLDKFREAQTPAASTRVSDASLPQSPPPEEFALIDKFFKRDAPAKSLIKILVGVGDDAAVVECVGDQDLAVSVDTMVAGVHFVAGTDPNALGHKLMAVNLSDLAAMGASPAWATLALTMVEADDTWLGGFADGMFALADQFGVSLIGGDTTQGPLTLTLQIAGYVPKSGALLRRGAQPGDGIYVTGHLGDAALGLRVLQGDLDIGGNGEYLLERLHRPQPRVHAGLALRGTAHCAIDISDGLCQDLGHVLNASGVGASIDLALLPLSDAYRSRLQQVGFVPALNGGDDYELLFTLNDARVSVLNQLGVTATRIGQIEQQPGLRIQGDAPADIAKALQQSGYRHFSAALS
jgi:thiamine-monophosphate kinase